MHQGLIEFFAFLCVVSLVDDLYLLAVLVWFRVVRPRLKLRG
jgi:hypothetical protein